MVRKIKYGKILVVVFITVVIWVWADLALDEKLTVSNVNITVAHGDIEITTNGSSPAKVSIIAR